MSSVGWLQNLSKIKIYKISFEVSVIKDILQNQRVSFFANFNLTPVQRLFTNFDLNFETVFDECDGM